MLRAQNTDSGSITRQTVPPVPLNFAVAPVMVPGEAEAPTSVYLIDSGHAIGSSAPGPLFQLSTSSGMSSPRSLTAGASLGFGRKAKPVWSQPTSVRKSSDILLSGVLNAKVDDQVAVDGGDEGLTVAHPVARGDGVARTVERVNHLLAFGR